MSVKIIIDSTSDVLGSVKNECVVVPLIVRFKDEEYIDGVTINYSEFYKKLIESDVLPTTSQATPVAFEECYSKNLTEEDEAVVITIASKLSGTYQSACIAASDYDDRIFVVDSTQATIGTSVLIERAIELRNEGLCAKEIASILDKEKYEIKMLGLLDTLEYLQKGGRISKAAAIAGGLLSIKPVIEINDGEIKVLGKARGSKQGNNFLVKAIEECGGADFSRPIMLAYSGLSDIMLQKYIEDSSSLWKNKIDNLEITSIGSVIGTHVGPGAIAVAFFRNKN